MNPLIFGTTGTALALLAMGMPRHFNHVFRKHPPEKTRRGLRVSGWLFLVLSLAAAVSGWKQGAGLVLWVALLAVHGFALSIGIAYRPKWVPAWTGLTALVGLAGLIAAIAALRF